MKRAVVSSPSDFAMGCSLSVHFTIIAERSEKDFLNLAVLNGGWLFASEQALLLSGFRWRAACNDGAIVEAYL